jgi:hypothetical protein
MDDRKNGGMNMKKSTLFSLFLAMVCTFLFTGASFAVVSGKTTPANGLSLQGTRPGFEKVLAVLEHRTGDTRLLDKAKDKLAGMSERRLRLAVSLSERADERNISPEHDIAFLLLATLIIFS